MVIFRSGNLYSLCSPGDPHYQEIIYFFNVFIKNYHILKFVGQKWVRPKKTASVLKNLNNTNDAAFRTTGTSVQVSGIFFQKITCIQKLLMLKLMDVEI